MKIVRYKTEGGSRYGIVEEGRLYPCAGDPFTGLKREKVDRSRFCKVACSGLPSERDLCRIEL